MRFNGNDEKQSQFNVSDREWNELEKNDEKCSCERTKTQKIELSLNDKENGDLPLKRKSTANDYKQQLNEPTHNKNQQQHCIFK